MRLPVALALPLLTLSLNALAADPAAAPAPAAPGMPAMKPFPKPMDITFCIFDILGTKGDAFSYAKDLTLEAKKWNVNATLKAYTARSRQNIEHVLLCGGTAAMRRKDATGARSARRIRVTGSFIIL